MALLTVENSRTATSNHKVDGVTFRIYSKDILLSTIATAISTYLLGKQKQYVHSVVTKITRFGKVSEDSKSH